MYRLCSSCSVGAVDVVSNSLLYTIGASHNLRKKMLSKRQYNANMYKQTFFLRELS
jgi:hypothetical protein